MQSSEKITHNIITLQATTSREYCKLQHTTRNVITRYKNYTSSYSFAVAAAIQRSEAANSEQHRIAAIHSLAQTKGTEKNTHAHTHSSTLKRARTHSPRSPILSLSCSQRSTGGIFHCAAHSTVCMHCFFFSSSSACSFFLSWPIQSHSILHTRSHTHSRPLANLFHK